MGMASYTPVFVATQSNSPFVEDALPEAKRTLPRVQESLL